MIYLLDTNVCVTYFRGKDLVLKQRVDSHRMSDIVLCSVVVAELEYGAALSRNPSVNRATMKSFAQAFLSLPFEDCAAERFGLLRAHLDKLGTPIGAYDLMIAAIALANGLILVTHNVKEFSRVPGLVIEDWQTP